MALTPQKTWARVPLTHPCGPGGPQIRVGPHVHGVPEGQPAALCSPVGDGERLYPSTPMSALTGETVEAPARMPARNGASTPSLGGREGIGTDWL